MLSLKTLADALTLLRVFCALFLARLAWFGDPTALPMAAVALLTAWMSDALDGPLARRDPSGRHTWIGDNDLAVDILVATGIWAYLWSAGYVSTSIGLGYFIVAGVLLIITRSVHVGWGIQAIPYGLMIYTTFIYAPTYAYILCGWILLIIIVTWPRFPQEKVPEFLQGIAQLLGRRT